MKREEEVPDVPPACLYPVDPQHYFTKGKRRCLYPVEYYPFNIPWGCSYLKMTIYNLYIYDRGCSCLCYKEWVRQKDVGISRDEELKLMYGMVYSLKSLVGRLSPNSSRDGFTGYATDRYRLSFYESPTGVKFILNTDHKAPDCRDLLQHIYAKVFVEYVVKDPLHKQGNKIESELFFKKLDEFVQSLPFFS